MPAGIYFSFFGRPWTSFWRPWGHPGHGLAELAWSFQNGLEGIRARAGTLLYWYPGIQELAKVWYDLTLLVLAFN